MIKGEGMDLYGNGSVDLNKMELDFVVMAVLFKTVDAIVTIIPGIGKKVGEDERSISAIPIEIKGPIKDPEVRLFSEDSLTRGIFELFNKTLEFPFKLFRHGRERPDTSGENDGVKEKDKLQSPP